jgi:hypothetical protein
LVELPQQNLFQELYLGTIKLQTLRFMKLFHASWITTHCISPCSTVSNVPLIHVTTLLWESVKMRRTLPKWGLGSPPRLPKVQSSIARVKTLCIGEFWISLESYWSVDGENGLAWVIWTSATLVMAQRKARSQTDNLTPDH